jgi:N-carbamoyl-L-amino-acid hydrolase
MTSSFDELWSQIAPIGRSPNGGYRRFAWTAADAAMRDWFAAAARGRGLDVQVDRNGNSWAWWIPDGHADEPAFVMGSHLDSVPDGGAFDGPLGVVSALCAIDELRARGVRLRKPIAVVVFADEEGARFGVACVGSRLMTGVLDPDRARALTDTEGVSLADAMRATGVDVNTLGRDDELLRRIDAFVEVHVEQGRDLIDRGSALAVATAIIPHGRWRVTFQGEGNHAGTTPMTQRRDPVVALAAGVLAVRDIALRSGPLARGTVGRIVVTPGGSNVIASRAQAWVDVRADTDDAVRRQVEELTAALAVVAERESCTVEVREESFSTRVGFDPVLRDRIADVLGGVPAIPTGAGHDAGILAPHVRTAMIFVRNPSGVSHAPEEGATDEDCEAGAVGLAAVLKDLAGTC